MKIDRRRPEDEMRECEVIFARTHNFNGWISCLQEKFMTNGVMSLGIKDCELVKLENGKMNCIIAGGCYENCTIQI